jgi:hypothetical protein
MSRYSPSSWKSELVGWGVAVLAVSLALKLAASFLREALVVLVPVAAVMVLCWVAWRYFGHQHYW